MRMKIGALGAIALMSVMSTGCDEANWYEGWYDGTPDVGEPDQAYDPGYLTFDTAYTEAFYLGCADDVHYWYTYAEFSGAASGVSATVSFTGHAIPDGYAEFYGGFYGEGETSCICEVYSEGGSADAVCDGDYTGNSDMLNDCAEKLPYFDYLYTEHYLEAPCAEFAEGAPEFSFTMSVNDFLSPGTSATFVRGEGSDLNYAL